MLAEMVSVLVVLEETFGFENMDVGGDSRIKLSLCFYVVELLFLHRCLSFLCNFMKAKENVTAVPTPQINNSKTTTHPRKRANFGHPS